MRMVFKRMVFKRMAFKRMVISTLSTIQLELMPLQFSSSLVIVPISDFIVMLNGKTWRNTIAIRNYIPTII